MKKYLYFFKIGFQVTAVYPVTIFFRLFRHAIIVGLFVILWGALFSGKTIIDSFDFRSIITYYILVEAVDVIYTTTPARLLNRDIQTGDLNNFLAKPMNYWGYLFFYTLGQQIASSSLSIIAIIGLFALFPTLVLFPQNLLHLLAYFVSCGLAFLLFHQLFFTIGTLSFWVSEISHIRSGFDQLFKLVGGKWIPLNFFPAAVLGVFNLLPFKFLFNFPVRIFQEQVPSSEIITGSAIELSWLCLFFVAGHLIWRAGLKGYAAYGR